MDVLDDVREMIKLNRIELLTMLKEYGLVYAQLLLFDLDDKELRKKLFDSFYKYYQGIQLENIYLGIIIDNIDLLDIERVNNFLDRLDLLNERTYQYHEQVLLCFEEKISKRDSIDFILPYRDFTTIIESEDCYLELKSIFPDQQGVSINSKNERIAKILSKNKKEYKS